MIDCKIITGFPFSEYNSLKNAIERESSDITLVYDDSFLEWEKTEENYKKLHDIKESVDDDTSTVYLVGYLYARHFTFFKDINNFDVSVNVIHVPPKIFVDRFKEKFESYSVPFFNRDKNRWPYYKEDRSKSPLQYITQFYYDFEEDLSEIEGFHFDENELKDQNFVNVRLYNSLFEFDKENSFYSLLKKDYEKNKYSPESKRTVKEYSNDNVRLLIASFLLPEEFNLFYKQSQALLRSFDKNLSNIDVTFRVHLDLSDFYVDWDRSKMDKEILYSNFYDLKNSFDSYCDPVFSCFEDNIHGCNDIRRHSVRNFSNEIDCFSWLDPDTKFPTDILHIYEKVLPRINNNYNLYGITPQIFRPETGYLQPLSIDTNFLYEKPSFESIHRLNKNKRSIKRLDDGFRVNGAFSVLSSRLLEMTDIPDELGYYGNDDIYVNECINIINNLQANSKVALFLVKNLVTYQDENWRNDDSLTSFIHKKLNENYTKGKNHKKTQSVLDQLYNNFKAKFL